MVARTMDEIAEEQAKQLGHKMLSLMKGAMEAEDIYSLDELEEYAASERR